MTRERYRDHIRARVGGERGPSALDSRLSESLSRLEQAVGQIQDSETFRRYLDAQSRFHRYSWGNVLLIVGQRSDATHVAGYRTWQRLNRSVRRGEQGIRILVPMSRKVTPEPGAGEGSSEEERREIMALREAVTDLLEGNGSEWEGQPQELLDTLEENTSAILPERPDELTKLLLKLGETGETFMVERSRVRAEEDSNKVVRWLKLTLRGPSHP